MEKGKERAGIDNMEKNVADGWGMSSVREAGCEESWGICRWVGR
jgi:hypothetical protein